MTDYEDFGAYEVERDNEMEQYEKQYLKDEEELEL